MKKNNQYYIFYKGKQFGPMDWAEVVSFGYPPTALVWTDGMHDWQALSSLMPEKKPPPVQNQQMQNQPQPYYNNQSIFANFGQRLAAYLLDGIILLFGYTVLSAIMNQPGIFQVHYSFQELIIQQLLFIIIGWIYFAVFESSELQATPGKMALKIKVTDLNYSRLSFTRATGRHFAKLLSALILFIGYLMIIWSDKRQGLHDQIAETLVVKKGN